MDKRLEFRAWRDGGGDQVVSRKEGTNLYVNEQHVPVLLSAVQRIDYREKGISKQDQSFKYALMA